MAIKGQRQATRLLRSPMLSADVDPPENRGVHDEVTFEYAVAAADANDAQWRGRTAISAARAR